MILDIYVNLIYGIIHLLIILLKTNIFQQTINADVVKYMLFQILMKIYLIFQKMNYLNINMNILLKI